jgi:hypothetical protein
VSDVGDRAHITDQQYNSLGHPTKEIKGAWETTVRKT